MQSNGKPQDANRFMHCGWVVGIMFLFPTLILGCAYDPPAWYVLTGVWITGCVAGLIAGVATQR